MRKYNLGVFGRTSLAVGLTAVVGCDVGQLENRPVPENAEQIISQCYEENSLRCWHNSSRDNPGVRVEICDEFENYLNENYDEDPFGDGFIDGHVEQCEFGVGWLER